MRPVFLAAILSALSAGCAYTESAFGDLLDEQTLGGLGVSRAGYSETPLATDAYRIHAFGNKNASHQKTTAVALVRAAALAEAHGYNRFVILDYDEWTKTSYRTTPTTATIDATTSTSLYATGSAYDVGSYRYANINGRANSRTTATATIHHGGTYAVEKPKTDIVVRFVASDSPEAVRALRVADVIASYGRMAGYKPKNEASPVQAATLAPAKATTPKAVAEIEMASNEIAPPASPRTATIAQSAAYDPALPTLDEVYRSLSPGEKARVNRLPPAQRADYLEQIRERSF